jgi:hypothetical protein
MASASNHAYQVERHWSIGLVGPYSEDRQFQRATAIKRLLETNPQLDELTRGMWENKLRNLAMNETTYNYRVRNIYSNMKRKGLIEYE